MSTEHFELSPVQKYSPPAYPTHGATSATSLKKLPVRWAKNVAIVACLSALSLSALTGCVAQEAESTAYSTGDDYSESATYSQSCDPYTDNESRYGLDIRTHFGGFVGNPFYVAHLTEQEALGIIRSRLYQAEMGFNSPISDYTATFEVELSPGTTETFSATLSLFDECTRQGIVFLHDYWANQPRRGFGLDTSLSDAIVFGLQQDFAERFDIDVTFIRNPGEDLESRTRNPRAEPRFSLRERRRARISLNNQLLYQVDALIDHLQSEDAI